MKVQSAASVSVGQEELICGLACISTLPAPWGRGAHGGPSQSLSGSQGALTAWRAEAAVNCRFRCWLMRPWGIRTVSIRFHFKVQTSSGLMPCGFLFFFFISCCPFAPFIFLQGRVSYCHLKNFMPAVY